jgi:hypothetical protein
VPSRELGDAEHLRVGHARSRSRARPAFARELLDEVGDALVEQVVAEIHHEGSRSR